MVNKLIPKVRFVGFTDDWEYSKLGEFGSVTMNKRIFKEETSKKGEVPFYKIGTFGGEADSFISRELFELYKTKYPYPSKGDLLISASGSIGRIVEYIGKDEYFQDSNIVWLAHDNRIVNTFLKQFYNIVKWKGVEGSTIKRLYNKNILETNITLPSPKEQTQIGNFFKQLDETITLQERKMTLLKEQKKGFLQKMFPKEWEKVPEIRFGGFTDDWEERKLGEILKINSGKDYKHLEIGDVPVYGTGGYMLSVADKLSEVDGIGIGRKGTINKPQFLKAPFWTVDTLFFMIPLPDFDINFIFSLSQKINWKKMDESTGVPSLSKTVIEKISEEFPLFKEQTKIGNFFKQLDDTITLEQRKLDSLKELKKAYLQKMFV